MVDGKYIQEFWARWEHEPNPSQEFEEFKHRVIAVSAELWDKHFSEVYDDRKRTQFAIISGTPRTYTTSFAQSGLCSLLEEATTVFAVANAIQRFLWTAEEVLLQVNFHLCCREIQRVFDLSPAIMIRLVRHGDTATIYPMGVRMLDEAVVESSLIWLSQYPSVSKHFETALKLYMSKDPAQYRNMLDNLRFALEQMLRVVLKNQKSLENQKDEFLRWLKAHDVHVQIGNMYHDLLFGGFAQYQNDAVKHQEDNYTVAEIEFVLYATGTFLRLIQRVGDADAKSKR